MRHNALRDLLLRFARSAGYSAVAEKPGLLPGDTERRPADVWLSGWTGSLPAAVDLAVMAGGEPQPARRRPHGSVCFCELLVGHADLIFSLRQHPFPAGLLRILYSLTARRKD